ncbi:hypothetical protein [Staphylococcus equorum]|uniref:hypothetical protein n=2 Tax=Staphylococcus TaxID=1279 RepID=UPI00115F4374|nr:hypothetical protein [Staphylococcus equorum]
MFLQAYMSMYAIAYGILLLSTDWISSGWSLAFVLSFAAIGILSDIVAPKKRNNSENSQKRQRDYIK